MHTSPRVVDFMVLRMTVARQRPCVRDVVLALHTLSLYVNHVRDRIGHVGGVPLGDRGEMSAVAWSRVSRMGLYNVGREGATRDGLQAQDVELELELELVAARRWCCMCGSGPLPARSGSAPH